MNGNVIVLLRTINITGLGIASLYFLCSLGERLTQRFEDLGDAFYDFSWYSLPVSMQKEFKLMISISQKPVYLRGYVNTRANRILFAAVLLSIMISVILT